MDVLSDEKYPENLLFMIIGFFSQKHPALGKSGNNHL